MRIKTMHRWLLSFLTGILLTTILPIGSASAISSPNVFYNGTYYYDQFLATALTDSLTTIMLSATPLPDASPVVFNRPGVTLTIQGGYDNLFNAFIGSTVLGTSLTISQGTLIVDNLTIGGTALPPGDTTPPKTTANPSGGSFTAAITVQLAVNETATIYYTTDGSTPTTASTVYSGLIPINATTTLKYFARDSAGNSETTKSAIYTINAGGDPQANHANLTFTSTALCLQCHTKQATDMANSVHYKWEGPYSKISNKPTGTIGGKLNTAVNAYCINTLGNWNG